jgi:hypothetical protein
MVGTAPLIRTIFRFPWLFECQGLYLRTAALAKKCLEKLSNFVATPWEIDFLWFNAQYHTVDAQLPQKVPKQKTCQTPRKWVISDYPLLSPVYTTLNFWYGTDKPLFGSAKPRLHYAQFLVPYHFLVLGLPKWVVQEPKKWYGYQFYPCRTKN